MKHLLPSEINPFASFIYTAGFGIQAGGILSIFLSHAIDPPVVVLVVVGLAIGAVQNLRLALRVHRAVMRRIRAAAAANALIFAVRNTDRHQVVTLPPDDVKEREEP